MKILSIDLGDSRTGIAICDKMEMLASPLTVLTCYHQDQLADQIALLVAEHKAERIILGHPINMNGTYGPRSELVQSFATLLQERTPVPIKLWDERSTTVSAAAMLNDTNTRGKKRKAVIDAVAAVIILDSYLQYRRNHPEQ